MNALRTFGIVAAVVVASACQRGATSTQSGVASLRLSVDGTGYHPPSLSAPPGRPVRLVITRTSDEGCGQQIVFPSLDIKKDLPLNRPVTVEFTMPASGSLSFTCGMNMLRGSIIAG